MYSGYIEDKLADKSYHIKLLKLGIENYKANWLGEKYFANLNKECFSLLNDIFANIRHNLDEAELDFAYTSIYSQAGFKESIELFANFVDGLTVTVTCDDSFYWTIEFDTDKEIIRDYELFKKQIGLLVRELLFFKDYHASIKNYTLEFNMINKIANRMTVTSRNYRFFEIYIPEEYPPSEAKTENYYNSVGPLNTGAT